MAVRRLDRRTIAISACIAFMAAFAAGLVANLVLDDGTGSDSTGTLVLTETGDIDVDEFLAVPIGTTDGGNTTLGDQLDGRPTLVNFWQSTCAPCIEEMPLLEQTQTTEPDLAIVGLATQDPPEDAAALAEQTGITYPWFLDPEGEAFLAARAAALPTTLLLDGDGDLLGSETGTFADAAELQTFLDRYLPER